MAPDYFFLKSSSFAVNESDKGRQWISVLRCKYSSAHKFWFLFFLSLKVDDLEEVSEYYQNRGCFSELISLMESGLGLERAHMGIFTELGVLYARYRPEKLMEHIKLFSTRLNIPKLIRACDEQQHWKELTYLYIQYDEFDNAATTIMNHSPEAWDHMQFKDVVVKVANVELYYKAVHFYLQEHPDLINDLLNVIALRVDHTRVVDIMRKVHFVIYRVMFLLLPLFLES